MEKTRISQKTPKKIKKSKKVRKKPWKHEKEEGKSAYQAIRKW
ncbi:hypothetical protein ACFL5Z_15670 [Planctomycetota bacterium]